MNNSNRSINPGTSIPTEVEKARSLDLVRNRQCPHCHEQVSLSDAISMIQGDGWRRAAVIEADGGIRMVLDIDQINPQTMRVIEPE